MIISRIIQNSFRVLQKIALIFKITQHRFVRPQEYMRKQNEKSLTLKYDLTNFWR